MNHVEDYFIFSREDYLLSGRSDKWIDVEIKKDHNSDDLWAKCVGWYEANIDGNMYVFPKLYDALKTYDAHMAHKKSESAELKLPDELLNDGR
eukprot:scaffold170218_cov64-Cyclotella_meneghiniana.AAC.1